MGDMGGDVGDMGGDVGDMGDVVRHGRRGETWRDVGGVGDVGMVEEAYRARILW